MNMVLIEVQGLILFKFNRVVGICSMQSEKCTYSVISGSNQLYINRKIFGWCHSERTRVQDSCHLHRKKWANNGWKSWSETENWSINVNKEQIDNSCSIVVDATRQEETNPISIIADVRRYEEKLPWSYSKKLFKMSSIGKK